jgi:hypothetical protein
MQFRVPEGFKVFAACPDVDVRAYTFAGVFSG